MNELVLVVLYPLIQLFGIEEVVYEMGRALTAGSTVASRGLVGFPLADKYVLFAYRKYRPNDEKICPPFFTHVSVGDDGQCDHMKRYVNDAPDDF
jgi:hypothetical protein